MYTRHPCGVWISSSRINSVPTHAALLALEMGVGVGVPEATQTSPEYGHLLSVLSSFTKDWWAPSTCTMNWTWSCGRSLFIIPAVDFRGVRGRHFLVRKSADIVRK